MLILFLKKINEIDQLKVYIYIVRILKVKNKSFIVFVFWQKGERIKLNYALITTTRKESLFFMLT